MPAPPNHAQPNTEHHATARPSRAALHAALLRSPSATAVLETLWGETLRAQPRTTPHPLEEAWQAIAQAQLAPGPSETLSHRRVTLLAGLTPVSAADLFFVPERLTPHMRAALATSDTPFGRIIAPLSPYRDVLHAELCSPPSPDGLIHHALISTANHPLALAIERYPAACLSQP